MNSPSRVQKGPEGFPSSLRPIAARLTFDRIGSRSISGILLLATLLPVAGMHMLGFQSFYWFELNIVPWDFAIVLGAVLVSFLVLVDRIEVPNRLPIVFYLITGLAVWFAIEAARSPTPFRGWTMVLLLLRDFAMFGTVFLVLSRRTNTAQLNLWVSIAGIAFTVVALPLFLLNLNTFGERLPFNGMIVLFEHTTPRFIGFARDPNFYGLTASISLVTLSFAAKIPLRVRWLGTALLVTAILFTGSRLLPVSLLAGMAFLVGTLLVMRQANTVRQLLLTLVPGFLIALLLVPLWFQVPDQSSSLGSRLFDRYSLGTNTPRTDLWRETVESFNPNEEGADDGFVAQALQIMLGNGLRSNQEALNGQYSHNTYLDLFGETGIIGSLIWLAITGLVSAQGFRAVLRNPALTPWLAVWLTTLLFFSGFSLLVAPYYWFIAAVICGLSFRDTNAASRHPHTIGFRSVHLGSGS